MHRKGGFDVNIDGKPCIETCALLARKKEINITNYYFYSTPAFVRLESTCNMMHRH